MLEVVRLIELRFMLSKQKALPWLRRLLAGFPPRGSVFEPGSSHLRSVVGSEALGQVSIE